MTHPYINILVRTNITVSPPPVTILSISFCSSFLILGFLSLNEELDYETIRNYSLTVEAINSVSGTRADVIVDIQVTNINDCYPTFTADSYNISVPEDVHVGSKLLQIEAHDEDEGNLKLLIYHVYDKLYNINLYL